MLHEDLSAAFPGGPGEHEPIPHVGLGGSATRVSSAIAQGISAHMERATALGFSGLVVGLSGGVDSAVACALAARSSWPVHALVVEMDLPDGLAPDTVRSRQLADRLDVAHTFVNASQLYREHLQLLPDNPVLTRVHLRSRVVTTLILQLADSMSCLAIDTTDRSEIVLRMYEESFRGHVAPLAGLYKSQVYEIGDALGLSDLRVVRSGCPARRLRRLRPGVGRARWRSHDDGRCWRADRRDRSPVPVVRAVAGRPRAAHPASTPANDHRADSAAARAPSASPMRTGL